MESLIEYIAKSLVDDPSQVEVRRRTSGTTIILELRVAPEDAGRVIGIAAMIVAGLALAIPSPDVEAFVAQAAPGPRLGLVAHTVELPGFAGTALALDRVEPGLPAARAGLEAGDVLVTAGGRPLHSTSDLVWSVRQASDEWLTVDLVRTSFAVPVVGGVQALTRAGAFAPPTP